MTKRVNLLDKETKEVVGYAIVDDTLENPWLKICYTGDGKEKSCFIREDRL